MKHYDAIVVGARCAGSSLAIGLARRDWEVLVVDRDRFPSTTISTHGIWPNGVARLSELGILDQLRSAHEVPMYESVIRGLGHEARGGFTTVGGFDRALAPRRIVLDQSKRANVGHIGAWWYGAGFRGWWSVVTFDAAWLTGRRPVLRRSPCPAFLSSGESVVPDSRAIIV